MKWTFILIVGCLPLLFACTSDHCNEYSTESDCLSDDACIGTYSKDCDVCTVEPWFHECVESRLSSKQVDSLREMCVEGGGGLDKSQGWYKCVCDGNVCLQNETLAMMEDFFPE